MTLRPDLHCTHCIPPLIKPLRLCDYLPGVFPGLETKSGVKKAIKRGQVHYNNLPATTGIFISAGDQVEWRKPVKTPGRTFRLAAEIIFEDDYLAVVNKPAGVVVSGNQFRTLENALPGLLQPSILPDALPSATAIHRLDSDTSGLLMVAKTPHAHLMLSRQMEARSIAKTYHAIVIGIPPKEGVINQPVEGREAITRFRLLHTWNSLRSQNLSMLEISPETGRTHQIRRHLSEAGFPILGDRLYGIAGLILLHKGLFLCATGLRFSHPITGEPIILDIETPAKFIRYPQNEQKRYNRTQ